jgi:hypothetical protein
VLEYRTQEFPSRQPTYRCAGAAATRRRMTGTARAQSSMQELELVARTFAAK